MRPSETDRVEEFPSRICAGERKPPVSGAQREDGIEIVVCTPKFLFADHAPAVRKARFYVVHTNATLEIGRLAS